MQYLPIEPPSPPNPCYDDPSPVYCTRYPEMGRMARNSIRMEDARKSASLKGMHIDVDVLRAVWRKRFIYANNRVEKLQ
jgi:hypothetical protein